MPIKLFLAVSGLIVIALGSTILLAPVPFYAGYGLDLAGEVTLLNELRSHGLSLIVLGAIIASGAVLPRMVGTGLLAAAFVYLSYGASRLVAIAFDGRPADGLLAAMAVELAVGGLAAILYVRARNSATLAVV